jgi:glycosyltransferase involved in cell wall biosynthesis
MAANGRVREREDSRPRDRFGFFGQVNRYEGVEVLLEAMELVEYVDPQLWLFGGSLEVQPLEFRERFRELLERNPGRVTYAGPYKHEELGKLMAEVDWVVVPSIWWETGPAVVPEAFQRGRPVICSDVGQMSEIVGDGVNGLHFRNRDVRHLAEVIARAAGTPGLWEDLWAGIPSEPPRSMDDHVEILSDCYRRLIASRAVPGMPAASAAAPPA